jgi:hypothetical protein
MKHLRLACLGLTLTLALSATAFAGDIGCPGVTDGTAESPGITGPQESPGFAGGIEMPGITGDILLPGVMVVAGILICD